MDSQIINPAARRISGLPLSTRIESLHLLAGTQTIRNLYIQHCAEFVHASITAENSYIQTRLQSELRAIFRVNDLQASPQTLPIDLEASTLLDSSEVPLQVLRRTKWMAM